jgi:hypothetical protein
MPLLRLLSAAGGLLLAGLIVWAMMTAGQSLSEAIAWLVSGPWGVVTLADLYLGFALLAVLIWMLEPDKRIALLFILPLPLLGNVWAAVWIALRLKAVTGRLRGAD